MRFLLNIFSDFLTLVSSFEDLFFQKEIRVLMVSFARRCLLAGLGKATSLERDLKLKTCSRKTLSFSKVDRYIETWYYSLIKPRSGFGGFFGLFRFLTIQASLKTFMW